ncbi:MAG: helix-turn-helix transcriptional regulator [Firmicutes bacterium]|nr:helix-turn-helix transcriptional regulator [Bacillota bacterium]
MPEKSKAADPLSIPMEKLTQPAILLLLHRNEAHGYDLIQKLSQARFIDSDPDTATVYRALRRMEQDGLVVSSWKHGEFGPARRQYRLTPEGLKLLEEWIGRLEERKKQIDSFIGYYRETRR